ncbi:hypothetical protein ACRXCV_00225 (plasmid) [Halobacteriovorax sp. GFR7]|uniref:hypothetical protein n=1 Tax=unclassified Halobacteriovorax TaxID=2639665 RepID=UPI003D9920FB
MKVCYENKTKTDHGKTVVLAFDGCTEVRIGKTIKHSKLNAVRALRVCVIVKDNERVYIENDREVVTLETKTISGKKDFK